MEPNLKFSNYEASGLDLRAKRNCDDFPLKQSFYALSFWLCMGQKTTS